MLDRMSVYPGRVLITPADGSPPFLATLTWADEPEVEGTPLNKASLLQDQTARLLGLEPVTATPNDALMALASRSDESTFQKLMTGRLL